MAEDTNTGATQTEAETPATPAPAVPAETAKTESTPAPAPTPATEPTPATAPTETPAPVVQACKCPNIKPDEWDKKTITLDKTFFKTWSPRIMFMPFSFAIDLNRAKQGALKKGYKIPEDAMILDSGGMFMSNLMIEVTGADPNDPSIVSLAGKNLYAKVSTRPWVKLKDDFKELETELAKKPAEVYLYYTACPKCEVSKDVKTILLAVV